MKKILYILCFLSCALQAYAQPPDTSYKQRVGRGNKNLLDSLVGGEKIMRDLWVNTLRNNAAGDSILTTDTSGRVKLIKKPTQSHVDSATYAENSALFQGFSPSHFQTALGFTPENVSNKATTLSYWNQVLYPSMQTMKNFVTGTYVPNYRIIIAGQSNAIGRADTGDLHTAPLNTIPDNMRAMFKRVYVANLYGDYIPLQVAISNMGYNAASFGAEIAIAYQFVLTHPYGNLFIDKYTVDGASITFFEKGSSAYTNFEGRRVNMNNWLSHRGIHVIELGFLWMQGESDYTQTYSWYKPKLDGILNNFIADHFMDSTTKIVLSGISTHSIYYGSGVETAFQLIINERYNSRYLNNNNTPLQSDSLHYNGEGQFIVGYGASQYFFTVDALTITNHQKRYFYLSGVNGKNADSVTSEITLTTADIATSTNKNYVNDAQLTVLGNTSGINTGDQDLSSYLTSATASSTYVRLSGSYTNPSWLVSLPWSKITSTPTTLSGYAISDAQPLDADLTTLAGLTATTDNFIVSSSSAWASRTPAQVKSTLSLNLVENTALSTWAGTANITTLGTISSGTWNGGIVAGLYGGTGVANSGKTITLGGNITTAAAFVTSGANSLTLTTTGTTNVTFPTSGTLITTTNVSGSSGFLARFSATNTLTTAVTRDDGSNVAIGTSINSSFKLLVNGATGFLAASTWTAGTSNFQNDIKLSFGNNTNAFQIYGNTGSGLTAMKLNTGGYFLDIGYDRSGLTTNFRIEEGSGTNVKVELLNSAHLLVGSGTQRSNNNDIEVQKNISVLGSTGAVFQWDASTSAPSTSTIVLPTTVYGTSGALLAAPTKWILISTDGGEYKVPAY